MNVRLSLLLCGIPGLLMPPASASTVFGSGPEAFAVDFVTIGNADNAADTTGYGAVDHSFGISAYETSRAMINSYNSLSGGPTISMFDYAGGGVSGGNAADRPATGVSWIEAALFVNWLNTSSGSQAAYNITIGAGNSVSFNLWDPGDAGYNVANPYRNSEALYFLPSENEWYKAAYFDPESGTYHDFATGSDTAPTITLGGTSDGTAVYGQAFSTGPAGVTNAGGLSSYGTMGQGGNAWEWMESAADGGNDDPNEARSVRGGFWGSANDVPLLAGESAGDNPGTENSGQGFRIAVVPEPSAASLLLMVSAFCLLRRNR